MVLLANCPLCEVELSVPRSVDAHQCGWCPACGASFKLREATWREVAEVALAGEATWDDSEQMARILADIRAPAVDEVSLGAEPSGGGVRKRVAVSRSLVGAALVGVVVLGLAFSMIDESPAMVEVRGNPNVRLEPAVVRASYEASHDVRTPSYSVDELRAAMEAARRARAGLIGGDTHDPDVRRTKGLSYAKLCRLAEVMMYVKRESRDARQAVRAAEQILQHTLADRHARDEVARILPSWIDSPHRTHGGVFFAGTVIERRAAGSDEWLIEMGAGSPLAVVAPANLANQLDANGRMLAVAGTIVNERTVWVSSVLPLD